MKTALHILAALITAVMIFAAPAAASSLTPGTDTIVVSRQVLASPDFRPRRNFVARRVGLALSGGGARGIAQIGVLKAFDEAGLDVTCIAGTSMGSVIGGLYASGFSARDIEQIVQRVDFTALFSDSPQRRSLLWTQRAERDRYLLSIRFDGVKPFIPRALTAGQRLTTLLTDLTIRADYNCGGNFDLLPIPFRAVATDIGIGKEVILRDGSLADAMRASMAFPLAFTPVELDGRHLLDGGIVNPLPVYVCRTMGADYVIAVNTVSTLLPADRVNNPIDIANQVTAIMSQDALIEQLREADYIITPRMDDFETFDFRMHDTLVTVGYHAGKRAAADIMRALTVSEAAVGQIIRAIEIARPDPMLQTLRDRFPLRPGQPCTRSAIQDALVFADREMRFYRLLAILEADADGLVIRLDGEPNRTGAQVQFVVEGSTVMADSVVTAFFRPAPDSVLSLATVKSAADSVVARLRRHGYDLANVHAIRYDHHGGTVTVELDEGLLHYVDIRGNERTRSWIIKANYPLRPGEAFDVRKSEKGLANIYGTGFFERVSLDIKPTEGGAHLTINVKEKKFTQLRIGAHWDDEYQAEMFADILDDNVFGAGIQVLGHALLSSRRNTYRLSARTSRLSKTLITARTSFYFSRLRRRLFQTDGAPLGYRVEDRLGWSILVGQQIARLGVIDFEYRLEDIHTRLTLTAAEEDHVLSAFAVKSTVETFNKFPYPDYGHRQDMALEFAGQWLGGTFEEYTKVSGAVEAYAPIGKYVNFHPRIAAGISTANLPVTEKFYIGGMYDFSGYRTDQLAGDKYVVTNLQLRLKLPYRLYLLGNVDFGNVFDEYENIKIRDFRTGWGAALSIDTPIGPVDFGYGKAEEIPWRLYLNIGLRF